MQCPVLLQCTRDPKDYTIYDHCSEDGHKWQTLINTDRAAQIVNGIGFDGLINATKNFMESLLIFLLSGVLHCKIVFGETHTSICWGMCLIRLNRTLEVIIEIIKRGCIPDMVAKLCLCRLCWMDVAVDLSSYWGMMVDFGWTHRPLLWCRISGFSQTSFWTGKSGPKQR